MWPWQQLVVHSDPQLVRILYRVSAAHVIFLCLIFFVFTGEQVSLQLSISGKPTTVIFVPSYYGAQKIFSPSTAQQGPGSLNIIKASVGFSAQRHVVQSVKKKGGAEPAATHTRWIGADAHRIVAHKHSKKQKARRGEKISKQHKKSPVTSIVEPQKKKPLAQDQPEQVVAKKAEIAQEKIEKTVSADAAGLTTALPETTETAGVEAGAASLDELIAAALAEGQQVICVGESAMEAVALQAEIHEALEKTWHPPAGIGAGQTCVVRVSVDWTGRAAHVHFERSSPVAAFNLSVRHAVLATSFPTVVRGKELLLPFVA